MDVVGFGRGLRALRRRKGLRQQDLADVAGVSRGVIQRIESARADRVTVATLDRVTAPLGARVACRLTWNGDALDRLLDSRHAGIVEQVVEVLNRSGWLVATEVSFNEYGERGSVDVLAFHAATAIVVVIEVKSVVPDVQATLVTLDRKQRLARRIATARGWQARAVAVVLVVAEDRTARRRIDAHRATFGNAFPDRARAIRRWIAAPDATRPLRGLWFLSGEPQAGAARRERVARLDAKRGRDASS